MGRYTQRQRRGGGPGAAAEPPPPSPAQVVSTVYVGDPAATVNFVFDQPVTVVSNTPVFEYENPDLGWQSSDTVTQVDANTVAVVWLNGPGTTGLPWRIQTTPEPDVTSPGGFVIPESGTI